jgi:hypothetical protein
MTAAEHARYHGARMGNFEPKAWNLCASVVVVAACGPSKIGASDSAADAGTTEPSTDSSSDPECERNSDCAIGYECRNGVCKYVFYDDGWNTDDDGDGDPYSPCPDDDCPAYSFCFESCESIEQPSPGCEGPLGQAIPLALISGPALALTFVDADGDGRDELAVVTATHIELFDNTVDPPTLSLRIADSPAIDGVSAGGFDATFGDDLIVLFEQTVWLHGSDGASSFAAPNPVMVPLRAPAGMTAGNYLEGPATELIVWGDGAVAFRPGGPSWTITDKRVDDLTALDLDDPLSTVLIYSGPQELMFDLGTGETIATKSKWTKFVRTGSLSSESGGYYVTLLGDASNWRGVGVREGDGQLVQLRAVPIAAVDLATGDLDGDGNGDLVVWSETGEVGIELDPLGPLHCWRSLGFIAPGPDAELVLGDFDGDGDDEIAARFGGQVEIYFDD